MPNSAESARFLIESRMRDAERGNSAAFLELGVAFSCGLKGLDADLIEAHKWFNLAAQYGSEEGQLSRAELAEEMSAREIAEAQRRARAWLSGRRRLAA